MEILCDWEDVGAPGFIVSRRRHADPGPAASSGSASSGGLGCDPAFPEDPRMPRASAARVDRRWARGQGREILGSAFAAFACGILEPDVFWIGDI